MPDQKPRKHPIKRAFKFVAQTTGVVLLAPRLPGVVAKASTAVWRCVARDINAAGASFIVHGSLAAAAGIFFFLGEGKHREQREIKAIQIADALTAHDVPSKKKEELLRLIMHNNLPPWVQFREWQRAPLLQAVIRSIWPGLNKEVGEWVKNLIDESLSPSNGSSFGRITVKALDFGPVPISIDGVRVITNPSMEDGLPVGSMEVMMKIRWAGRPEVELALAKFPAASVCMRHLSLTANLRLVLDGFQKQLPLFDTLSVAIDREFEPKIDFTLEMLGFVGTGLIKAAQVTLRPVLEAAFMSLIDNYSSPNTLYTMDLHGTDVGAQPPPLGVLCIEVVRGKLAQQTGLLGRTRQLQPRLSLLLPPVSETGSDDHPCVKNVAMQGVFTHVDGKHGESPDWKEKHLIVVSSREQVLRLVLSHKRSLLTENSLLEPIACDYPLGTAEFLLSELLPTPGNFPPHIKDDDQFYTPPSSPRDRPMLPLINPPEDLGEYWYALDSIEATSMPAAVKNVLQGRTESSEADDDSASSIDDESGWLARGVYALQDRVLDPDGRFAYDSLDWQHREDTVAGEVLLRMIWQPLSKPDVDSTMLSKTATTDTSTLTEEANASAAAGASSCEPSCPNCGCHLSLNRLRLPLVTGVLAVFVKTTTLHYGKIPVIPTLSVSLERPSGDITLWRPELEINGKLGLPPRQVTSQVRHRHQDGMLSWGTDGNGQVFYLPTQFSREDLQRLHIRVEIGDVKTKYWGLGRRKHRKNGTAMFALDAFDSYECDVNRIAYGDLPVHRVMPDMLKVGDGVERKITLTQFETARSNRKQALQFVGSTRVCVSWYEVS